MTRLILSVLTGLSLIFSAAAASAQRQHDFARWEDEVAAFEQSDRTNPPPTDGLLFVGSSTIRLWNSLAQDFPGQPVINRGVGGCEIVDCTHFADRIIYPYRPRMIFFRCGGNDLWDGKSPEQVFGDFKEFTAKVRARLPETTIVFISWSPTPARWTQAEKEKQFNRLVEAFSRETPRIKYVETYDMVLGGDGKPRGELFMDDNLHFNRAGYQLLTERVKPFLPK